MNMKRRLYDRITILLCMMADAMLVVMMFWYVYEANDLSTALILSGILTAMILREVYHQWRMDHG